MTESEQAAKEIRARHYHAFRIAEQNVRHELHVAVSSILNGGYGKSRVRPFEDYQRASTQLSLDALTPDDVLLAEARHTADRFRSYRAIDEQC